MVCTISTLVAFLSLVYCTHTCSNSTLHRSKKVCVHIHIHSNISLTYIIVVLFITINSCFTPQDGFRTQHLTSPEPCSYPINLGSFQTLFVSSSVPTFSFSSTPQRSFLESHLLIDIGWAVHIFTHPLGANLFSKFGIAGCFFVIKLSQEFV